MSEGRVVKVAKAPATTQVKNFNSSDLLEELCWYYPCYSFTEARQIPYFRVRRLLKLARKKEAQHYYELTQIVASPHTKGGDLYKQLTEHYRERANG